MPPTAKVPVLAPVTFAELTGWAEDDPAAAWNAFQSSCRALQQQAPWREVCTRAAALPSPDSAAARNFFETHFIPYRVAEPDGATTGLVTGYYEPVLRGSRVRVKPYLYPLYSPPNDLIVVDLASVVPESKNLRLRGRLEGRRLVPYYTRAEIDRGLAPLAGRELVWVDDPIEALYLHIQGSGRIRLPNGETLRVGYAEHNGQPFGSVARYLVERGELPAANASMANIQAWARAHPKRLEELLAQNPSYVFFRFLPNGDAGPPGTLGAPLTAGRSIAVDPRYVPLGAPVFLATTQPGTETPLARLVLAQDTGSAIKGAVRADYYWGSGADAGREAGRTRQTGRMWVLLPRGFPLPAS